MAKNETGIAITIKAWLPTGKGLDEQFAALSLVKQAHSTGDYAALLKAAKVEAVQTDGKTRRVEDVVVAVADPINSADIPTMAPNDGIGGIAFGVDDRRWMEPINPEPAATDDALAERPALDDPDGVVVEPAADVELKPRGKKAA